MPQIKTKTSTAMNIINNSLSMTGMALSSYFTEAMPNTVNNAKGLMNSINKGTELIGQGLKQTTQIYRMITRELSFRKILGWFTKEESELDDFGLGDFESNFSIDSTDDSENNDELANVTITEEAKSANKIAKSVVSSSHKLAETSIAASATMITSIDSQTKTIAEGFSQTNEILNKLLEITTKNTSSLVEATIAANALNNKNQDVSGPDRHTDAFLGSGQFNFDKYQKILQDNLYKNPTIAQMLGSLQIISTFLDNDLAMKQFLSRDFLVSSAFSLGMNHFLPNIGKVMGELDKSLNQAIMDGLLALGNYGKNGNGGLLKTIAGIFGIDPEKDSYAPNRKSIEVGPVPFDGITREAIVNTIPGYLQQILVALGGKDVKYDYQKRTFSTADEMRKTIMMNLTNTDTMSSLSDTLINAIAGNKSGSISKKDKYITEMLMQSLMNEMDLSSTIGEFNDPRNLERYIRTTALGNVDIDPVLQRAITSFSGRVSNTLANADDAYFDLFKSVQKQKLESNSLLDAENIRENIYDIDTKWIFDKNQSNDIGRRLLSLQNGVVYKENQTEEEKENSENISPEKISFADSLLSPLDYISKALYEIYRKINIGINVFKVGEYSKGETGYRTNEFDTNNLLDTPEGYHPLTITRVSSSSTLATNAIKTVRDLMIDEEENQTEEKTPEQITEERWKDNKSDPFEMFEVLNKNKIKQENERNLLLNADGEDLNVGQRYGRFAKNHLGKIFGALMQGNSDKTKREFRNIFKQVKEYWNADGKDEIFGNNTFKGFGTYIDKYRGPHEATDQLVEQEKEYAKLFDTYQKAALTYDSFAKKSTENMTEEELDDRNKTLEELKQKFLEAKTTVEKSFEEAGLSEAFEVDTTNTKELKESKSKAVYNNFLKYLENSLINDLSASKIDETSYQFDDRVANIDSLKDSISELGDEDEFQGLINLAKFQKGTSIFNKKQGGPEDLTNPLDKEAIVTSTPGYRMFDGKLDFHTGTDLTAADGSKHTPIISQQSGIVSDILKNVPENNGDLDSYKGKYPSTGNFVEIQSKGGPEDTISTSYMHMEPNSTDLQIGDKVEVGDIIGRTGSSGRSTGDHLHYEQNILPSGGPEEDETKTSASTRDYVISQANEQKKLKEEGNNLEKDTDFKKLQKLAIEEGYRRASVKTSTITGGILGLIMGGPLAGVIAAGIGNLASRINVDDHVSTLLFGEKNAKDKDGILKPYTTALKDTVLNGVGDILKNVGVGLFNYYITPFKNLGQVLYMRMLYGKNDKESIFDKIHNAFGFAAGKVRDVFGTALDEIKDHFKGIGEGFTRIKDWFAEQFPEVGKFLTKAKDILLYIPRMIMSGIGKAFGGIFKGIGKFLGLDKFKEKGLLGGLFGAAGTITKNVLPLALFAANPLLGAGLMATRFAAKRIGKFTKGNEEGTIDANQAISGEQPVEQISLEESDNNSQEAISDNVANVKESVAPLHEDITKLTSTLENVTEEVVSAIEGNKPEPISGGPKIKISALMNKQNIGGPATENNENEQARAVASLAGQVIGAEDGLDAKAAQNVTQMAQNLASKRTSTSKMLSLFNNFVRHSRTTNMNKQDNLKTNAIVQGISSIMGWFGKKDNKKQKQDGEEKSSLFSNIKNILTGPSGLSFLVGSGTLGKFFLKSAAITYGMKKFAEWAGDKKNLESLNKYLPTSLVENPSELIGDVAILGTASSLGGHLGLGAATIGLGFKNAIIGLKNTWGSTSKNWKEKISASFDDIGFGAAEAAIGGILLGIPYSWPILGGALALLGGRKWISEQLGLSVQETAERYENRKEETTNSDGTRTKTGLRDDLLGNASTQRTAGDMWVNGVQRYEEKNLTGKFKEELSYDTDYKSANSNLEKYKIAMDKLVARAHISLKHAKSPEDRATIIKLHQDVAKNLYEQSLSYFVSDSDKKLFSNELTKAQTAINTKTVTDETGNVDQIQEFSNDELNKLYLFKPNLYRLPNGMFFLVDDRPEYNHGGTTLTTDFYTPINGSYGSSAYYDNAPAHKLLSSTAIPRRMFFEDKAKVIKDQLQNKYNEYNKLLENSKYQKIHDDNKKHQEELLNDFLLDHDLSINDVKDIKLYDDENKLNLSNFEDIGGSDEENLTNINYSNLNNQYSYMDQDYKDRLAKKWGLSQNEQPLQTSNTPKSIIRLDDSKKTNINTISTTNTTNIESENKEEPKQAAEWGWPLSQKLKISSPYRSSDRPDHAGIDIAGIPDNLKNALNNDRSKSSGIGVLSTISGKATVVHNNVKTGYWEKRGEKKPYASFPDSGNYVRLISDDGKYAVSYMHLAPNTIPSGLDGKHVVPGQKIGELGNTGHSSGPHLHYQINMKGAPKPKNATKNTALASHYGWDINPLGTINSSLYDPSLENYSAPAKDDNNLLGGLFGWIEDLKNRFLKTSGLGALLFGMNSDDVKNENGDKNTNEQIIAGIPKTPKTVFSPVSNNSKIDTSNLTTKMKKLINEHGQYIIETANKYNYPVKILLGQIEQESGGDPNAKSPAGAKGLMQFVPSAARDYGIAGREYDPRASIDAGARYMSKNIKNFGNLSDALMAYNWGPGNVRSYIKRGRTFIKVIDKKTGKLKDSPPAEARNYAPSIAARADKYQIEIGGPDNEYESMFDIGGPGFDWMDLVSGTINNFVQTDRDKQQRIDNEASLKSALKDTILSSNFIKNNSTLSKIVNRDNLDMILKAKAIKDDIKQQLPKVDDRKNKLEELRKNIERYDDSDYLEKRFSELTEKFLSKDKSKVDKLVTTLPETLESRVKKIVDENPDIKKNIQMDNQSIQLLTQISSLLQQVVGNTGASNDILGKINSKDFKPVLEFPQELNKGRVNNTNRNLNNIPIDLTNKSSLRSITHMLTGR